MTIKDLTGQRFTRLVVLSEAPRRKTYRMWKCLCDCGVIKDIHQTALREGLTQSCGCLRDSIVGSTHRTHGQSKTRLNWVWQAMLQRCNNPDCKQYFRYGGRGITVCKRWESYVNFVEDMGERPFHKATLERIDNDKGYFPDNVMWSTHKAQMRNTRRTRNITFNGKTLCIMDWAKELGMYWRTLYYRLDHFPIEEALTAPKYKIKAA